MSTWANKPANTNVILDYDFNKTTLASVGIFDAYGSSIATTDGTAPVSPSSCIKSRIEAGSNTGGMQLNYVFNTSSDMFVGISWRTNAGFEGRPQGNKTFFMRGPGANGFFLWGNDALSGGSHRIIWSFNTSGLDNSHITGSTDPGTPLYPQNSAAATVTRGIWYRIEAYVKKSTTNTSRDGTIRWWVNGVLVGNYTNTNYAGGGLNEWVWSETWDGTPNFTVTTAWEHYLDHLYIASASASGTGGGTTTPTFSSLTPSTLSLAPGNTQTLTASMSAGVSSNTVVSLSSSNSAVASVPSSATITSGSSGTSFTVTAGTVGSAIITATIGGTSYTCAVTVSSTSTGTGTPTTYTYASQFSGVQGQNQWSYRDSGGNLLVYNGTNKWEGDELYLAIWSSGFVHGYTGTRKSAVLRWTAPAAGSAAVSGTALLYDSSGLGSFTVNYNSSTAKFGPQTMTYGVSYPYSFTQAVAAGDTIDFVMSGSSASTNDNTQLDPVIVFTPTTSGGSTVTISSMTPSSGNIGSSVTIVGTGFSATAINNTITVNGVPATITSASTTQLVFTVPTTATTGLVNVSTSTGSASAGTFTVTDPVTPDVPPASNFGGSAMLLLVLP